MKQKTVLQETVIIIIPWTSTSLVTHPQLTSLVRHQTTWLLHSKNSQLSCLKSRPLEAVYQKGMVSTTITCSMKASIQGKKRNSGRLPIRWIRLMLKKRSRQMRTVEGGIPLGYRKGSSWDTLASNTGWMGSFKMKVGRLNNIRCPDRLLLWIRNLLQDNPRSWNWHRGD